MSTTRVSSPTPAERPGAACPHCGRPRRWVQSGPFGCYEPCGCDGELAEQAERVAAEAAEHLERLAEGRRRRYRRAGIPEAWWSEEPGPGPREIAERARAGRGTWLVGDVGLGKTRAAMLAARVFLDSSVSVYGRGAASIEVASATVVATTEAEVLDGLRATFRRGGGDPADVVERYAACDLLVIDDLGKAAPTAWGVSQLFRVVDARYGRGLPLVATSQQGPAELIALLSADGGAETAKALVSRLCGMCDRMALAGPDRRLGGSL